MKKLRGAERAGRMSERGSGLKNPRGAERSGRMSGIGAEFKKPTGAERAGCMSGRGATSISFLGWPVGKKLPGRPTEGETDSSTGSGYLRGRPTGLLTPVSFEGTIFGCLTGRSSTSVAAARLDRRRGEGE